MLSDSDNYSAWNIDEKSIKQSGKLSDKLIFLLNYAVLAPSAHNTQPWLFEVGENYIKVFLDKRRSLRDSDPELRQGYESIGACCKNICIAATHFKLIYNISEISEVDSEKIGIYKLEFSESLEGVEPTEDDKLFSNIINRHSAKLDYLPISFPDSLKEIIEKCTDNNLTGVNMLIVSDKPGLKKISEIVAYGTLLAFQWPEFCRELRQWVRPNWTRKMDGMPCFTMGIPTFLSGIIPHLFGRIPLGKPQAKMVSKQVENSSAVVVLFGKNISSSWLNAGMIYEEIALKLLEEGWCSAVMGAPIELDKAAERLRQFLKIDSRPILFFRIGKQAGVIPVSPRRPKEMCIIKSV